MQKREGARRVSVRVQEDVGTEAETRGGSLGETQPEVHGFEDDEEATASRSSPRPFQGHAGLPAP